MKKIIEECGIKMLEILKLKLIGAIMRTKEILEPTLIHFSIIIGIQISLNNTNLSFFRSTYKDPTQFKKQNNPNMFNALDTEEQVQGYRST